MAKVKYYYDTNTCRFEKVEYTFKRVLLRAGTYVLGAVALSIAFIWIFFRLMDSPRERLLREEKDKLALQLKIQKKKISSLENVLTELEKRDDNLYRTILNTDPVPQNIRNVGVGGVERYKELEGYSTSELMIETATKLDNLLKKAYVQSKSFDELKELSEKRKDELAHTPAILPVNGPMISGFGTRIDPILRIPRLHPGIDFTCQPGTPIYATADGAVKTAGYEKGGYGIQVEIDHSFGYVTLYAHLSKVKVKRGQIVKRGDVIGYSGSTGRSVGPHLHYEIFKDGSKINPIDYFFSDLTPAQFKKLKSESEKYSQSMD